MLTKEQMDALPGLVERSTQGRRVQFMPDYCPEAVGTPFSDWDMSHDTSVILPDGTRYRGYAHHKHARDAELDGLARELAATVIEQQAEIERLRSYVADFANNEFERIDFPVSDPQDEFDTLTDWVSVYTWQEDARALLLGATQ